MQTTFLMGKKIKTFAGSRCDKILDPFKAGHKMKSLKAETLR